MAAGERAATLAQAVRDYGLTEPRELAARAAALLGGGQEFVGWLPPRPTGACPAGIPDGTPQTVLCDGWFGRAGGCSGD